MLSEVFPTVPNSDSAPNLDSAGHDRVIVIIGAMSSGKSTVAELLDRGLPKSVHVRGDSFRKMIVNEA